MPKANFSVVETEREEGFTIVTLQVNTLFDALGNTLPKNKGANPKQMDIYTSEGCGLITGCNLEGWYQERGQVFIKSAGACLACSSALNCPNYKPDL